MTNQARFSLTTVDDVPVIDAAGELDMTNVHELESRFAQAAEQNRGVVVVSLANVRYFDSRTIHALAIAAARLGKNRQQLVLVLPAMPSARVIFDMTGLKARLPVFDTRDEAIAYGRANRVELK
ncbi:MAG: STAS domain-containing protein [Candidatus Velthaea sp.]|jgi:anti-anti-sigma factor